MLRAAVGVIALMAFVVPSATVHAAGTAPGAAPFKYTYRITDLTVAAEFKSWQATVKTTLRLDGPSKMRWISYFGPKPLARPTQISVAVLYLTGKATYSSDDPSCGSKLEYRTSRSHPVKASLLVDTTTSNSLRIRISVDKFPLAVPLPGKDSGDPQYEYPNRCGEAAVEWYDNAASIVPGSVMTKSSFTVDAGRKETFGVESVDWRLKMTVKRLRHHLIDCPTEPGC